MRKRSLAGLLLVPFLLFGCLGPASEPDVDSRIGGDRVPEPSNVADVNSIVELNVLTGIEPERRALDEVAKMFVEQNPHVRINVQMLGTKSLTNSDGTPNTSVLQGVDLVFASSFTVQQLHQHGAVLDLSHLRLPAFDPAIAPLVDDLSTVDGKRIGVPISVTPEMIAINSAMLERTGAEPPPVDWTVDDWERMHAQVQAAEPLTRVTWAGLFLEPMALAYGGYLYDAPMDEWGFSQPETEQAMAWIGRQIHNGSLKFDIGTAPGVSSGEALLHLFTGPAPFRSPVVRPLPRGPGGVATRVTALMGFLPASTGHREEATAFLLEMVTNPAAQQALARTGIRPVSGDADAMATWQKIVGPERAEVTEVSLDGAYVSLGVPGRLLLDGLKPYFDGEVSYAEAVAKLLDTLEQSRR